MIDRGPHDAIPPAFGGAGLARAKLAMLLVHGRGASAGSMLDFAAALAQPDVACIAPQAARQTWYDHAFLAPLAKNEPGLSSGLRAIGRNLDVLAESGIHAERTILLGFSQGACLMLEYAARSPQRYAAIVGLSGGLIGSDEKPGAQVPEDKLFNYSGSLSGTPTLLGCHESDPHIPLQRVEQSAAVFESLGGDVEMRIYPGQGHGVIEDEVRYLRELLATLQMITD